MSSTLPCAKGFIPLCFLLAILLGCNTANHASPTHVSYEIWLSDLLHLDDYLSEQQASSLKPRQLIKQQLSAKWDFDIEVKLPQSNQTAMVNNCQDFFSADEQRAEPVKPFEFRTYRFIGTSCEAARIATSMQQSKSSFIRSLNFDTRFTASAPHQIALVISTEERKRLNSNPDIRYWSDIEKVESVEVLENNTFLFKTPGASHTLIRLAQGDVNADGIEDLLLRDDVSVDEGSYSSSRLFVLTRTSDDSDIELISMFPSVR